MPFTLLHDRSLPLTLSDEAAIDACCPAMDLVVFAHRSQIAVHRSIKWEKLFGMVSTGATCLAWRPDGKALAAGQEDGTVVVFDVESGAEFGQQYLRPHSNQITGLQWIAMTDIDDEPLREREDLLPGDEPTMYTSKSLEVLASGDASAIVTLSAFGNLPIGCVDLSGANGESQVTHVQLSPDLQTLLAIVHNPVTNMWRTVTVNTQILHLRASEIRTVAIQFGSISNNIGVIQDSLSNGKKQWLEGMKILETHFEPLEKKIQTYERPNTTEQELFVMFTSGLTSNALEDYMSELTESQLHKLAKCLDSTCSSVESTLSHGLYRGAEALVFHLHDLMGLAQWTENFESIGLNAEVLKNILGKAQLLLLKVQETLTWIHDARVNFAALVVWLLTVRRKMDDNSRIGNKPLPMVDSDRVVGLLSKQLAHPHITSQFFNQPLEEDESLVSMIWNTSMYSSSSLQQTFDDIESSWKKAFHMTSEEVSATFRPMDNVLLPCTEKRLVDVSFQNDGFRIVIGSPDSCSIKILCLQSGNSETSFEFQDAKTISDIRFYKEDQVLVVYMDHEDRRLLALLSVEPSGTLNLEKQRELLPPTWLTTGLSCQGSRGIAVVYTSNLRLQLFDVEDDDDESEYEEAEEEIDP